MAVEAHDSDEGLANGRADGSAEEAQPGGAVGTPPAAGPARRRLRAIVRFIHELPTDSDLGIG